MDLGGLHTLISLCVCVCAREWASVIQYIMHRRQNGRWESICSTRLFCYLGHAWLRRIWFPSSVFGQTCSSPGEKMKEVWGEGNNSHLVNESQHQWITKKWWWSVSLGYILFYCCQVQSLTGDPFLLSGWEIFIRATTVTQFLGLDRSGNGCRPESCQWW